MLLLSLLLLLASPQCADPVLPCFQTCRWGELDQCKSLKGYKRERIVMPNRCKYNCIKDQFYFEK